MPEHIQPAARCSQQKVSTRASSSIPLLQMGLRVLHLKNKSTARRCRRHFANQNPALTSLPFWLVFCPMEGATEGITLREWAKGAGARTPMGAADDARVGQTRGYVQQKCRGAAKAQHCARRLSAGTLFKRGRYLSYQSSEGKGNKEKYQSKIHAVGFNSRVLI